MTNSSKKWNWFKEEERANSRMGSTAQRGGSYITPMNYFDSVAQFYKGMDSMFENIFRGFGVPAISSANDMMTASGMSGMRFVPKANIVSNDREYCVTLEVPGIDERDISIELNARGIMEVRGERRQQQDSNRQDVLRMECAYGSFCRTLSLPEDVRIEDAEAEFENGLLTVTIPREASRRTQTRRLQINGRADDKRRDRGRDESRSDNIRENHDSNANFNRNNASSATSKKHDQDQEQDRDRDESRNDSTRENSANSNRSNTTSSTASSTPKKAA